MMVERPYDPTNRAQVVVEVRREILAARLRVTIDERLGRETPPVLLRLSRMKLPPIVWPHQCGCDTQADATGSVTND